MAKSKIASFFSQYFTVPSTPALHAAQVGNICRYAGTVLLLVGAFTSVPSLISSFFALWSSLFGDSLVSDIFAGIATAVMTAFVIFLVDMTLSAISPYLFKEIGRSIEVYQTQKKRPTVRGRAVLVLLSVLVWVLASISMGLSYDGNAAMLDGLFPNEKKETYHKEVVSLDSAKLSKKRSIEATFLPRITEAKNEDAAELETAKKDANDVIKAARKEAEKKSKNMAEYNAVLRKLMPAAKQDSSRIMSSVPIPSAPKIETSMNVELAEIERTFNVSKMAFDDLNKESQAKNDRLKKAVFALTGGLGWYATLLGLLAKLLDVLITWSPSSAGSSSSSSGSKRSVSDIKSDISTYTSGIKRNNIQGKPNDKMIESLKKLIEELLSVDASLLPYVEQEVQKLEAVGVYL
jgi:hypothetical protein